MTGKRIEEDSFGRIEIPENAYYGAQTQRAVDNFPISGMGLPPVFIRILGLVKKCAADVNARLGLLDPGLASAIAQAATEVYEGRLDDQFVVDVFQTGSGTSTNMNMNEVVAGRANEILTGKRGGRSPVHPNDHVNLGQSSNDVIPTVIHIAAFTGIQDKLIPSLKTLTRSLERKADEFSDVEKIGRTHLQDAVPITLGAEFSAFARQAELGVVRLLNCRGSLAELALGGTAVGNGLNTHPEFAARVIDMLSMQTGWDFEEACNHFEAQSAQDASVEASGALKTVAVSLMKIANDVRWLGSGPRYGLGEIVLPALQPGSSIMPGKVNPVLPEAVIQVAAQVIGNDAAITIAGQAGYFQLNTMLPVIAYNLLQSIDLLANVSRLFAERCIDGITVNRTSPNLDLERNLSLATHLAPAVGYDNAARIAKKAWAEGKTVREIAKEEKALPPEEIDKLLKM